MSPRAGIGQISGVTDQEQTQPAPAQSPLGSGMANPSSRPMDQCGCLTVLGSQPGFLELEHAQQSPEDLVKYRKHSAGLDAVGICIRLPLVLVLTLGQKPGSRL